LVAVNAFNKKNKFVKKSKLTAEGICACNLMHKEHTKAAGIKKQVVVGES